MVPIPTHRPMVRDDMSDLVFKSEDAKFKAVVEEIEELHADRPAGPGRHGLDREVGAARRAAASRHGVAHEVLNAKQHEREAKSSPRPAGRARSPSPPTWPAAASTSCSAATRRAWSTTSCKSRASTARRPPPEQVEAATREAEAICARDKEIVVGLGGLHILGTERHEARRIDNQLRGRAGRQGDPGSSRFFVSLEDDLMRRFGGSSIAGLMDKLGLEEDVPLEHSWVTKAIENAQTKVEAYNFDIRKHVVEYDDVMNKQREVIYADRRKVLAEENLRPMIEDWVDEELQALVADPPARRGHRELGLRRPARRRCDRLLPLPETVTVEELEERRARRAGRAPAGSRRASSTTLASSSSRPS